MAKKTAIKDAATAVLNYPGVQDKLIALFMGLFTKLLNRQKPPAAPLPPVITAPVPNPNAADPDLLDDVIPSPAADGTRKVTKVKLSLTDAQLNKGRFPNAPNGGLLPRDVLDNIVAGRTALNYGSKAWFDLTAYDQKGVEFLPGDVIAYGLQYKTEHHIGDAFIKGNGGAPQQPAEGYQTQDGSVGNGISSWIATLGFKHQVKFHGEGTYKCTGSVDGVESNSFTVRVS